MATLGIEAKITLSTDRTRNSLDNFYRGFKVDNVQILPYYYLSGSNTACYDVEDSSFFLFIGDVYDGSDPFDLVITNNKFETITMEQVNFIMLNATNLKKVEVRSSLEDSEDTVGYKVYYG